MTYAISFNAAKYSDPFWSYDSTFCPPNSLIMPTSPLGTAAECELQEMGSPDMFWCGFTTYQLCNLGTFTKSFYTLVPSFTARKCNA
jgi:hypothetical protein